nr:hypothetical protein [uncultured Cohaesibacter sp.]
MEVLIHIGDATHGSSFIQSGLHSFRKALLDKGILYNPVSTGTGHYSYITLLGGRTRGNDTVRAEMAAKNLRETSDLVSKYKPRYLLLSAENFLGANPEEISKLIDRSLGLETKKHIIAFLRHPVDFYLSTVQQQLKADHKFAAPYTFRRDIIQPLSLWRQQRDLKSISVRPFNESRINDSSAIAEFSSILRDITGDSTINIPDIRANNSLSVEQIILLQEFRRYFLPHKSGVFDTESNRIVSLFNELNEINKDIIGTQPELVEAVRACIIDNNIQNITEVDKAFPNVGLQNIHPHPDIDWTSDRGNWTSDVRSIMKGYIPEILNALKALLPQYSPDLTSGDRQKTLQNLFAPASSQQATTVYGTYLNQTGAPKQKPAPGNDAKAKINKVLVLGTSNSILTGGWVDGFIQRLPEHIEVHNKSVGGSPGTQFACWCDKDLSGYDCVIFDSVVNDENMTAKNLLGDESFYSKLIFEILSTIASQTNLIVLGFCNERFLKNKSKVYKIHQRIAKEVGGTFLSVADFAINMPEPRFRDGAHISIDISRDFGKIFAKDLAYYLPNNSRAKSYADNFKTIHVSQYSSSETVTRKSRLFEAKFCRLKHGDVVTLPPLGNIIGIQIDSSDTYGFAKFSGDGSTLVQSMRFPHREGKFLAYFIPVFNGFPAQKLEVVDAAETFVRSMHEETRDPPVECRLAVSTATFWKADQA